MQCISISILVRMSIKIFSGRGRLRLSVAHGIKCIGEAGLFKMYLLSPPIHFT
jgi:hypothetical protein